MNSSLRKVIILIISMVAVVFPSIVVASLPRSQIENIAREVTVLIQTPHPLKQGEFIKTGSGVIIGREEESNTYWILTAKHVATSSKEYKLRTPDNIDRYLSQNEVLQMRDTDLAVLKLRTETIYRSAAWGDSDELAAQDTIYIYGWPSSTSSPRFTSGKFVDNRLLLANDGYGLVYRDAQVENGMSGAPIFDENGKLVGIHGLERGGIARPEKLSLYQRGVSINSFFNDLSINSDKTLPGVTYLELCNKQESQKEILLAFAKSAGNNGWVTRGWFVIKSDSCQNFAIGNEYKGVVYFYAKDSDGHWGKGADFCVNNKKPFFVKNSDTVPCNDSDQVRVPMTELDVSPGRKTLDLKG
jgi:uncharacterized membrane protein